MRADIELIPWQKQFNDAAAEMLYQSYRHHVDALINDQYASLMGATRLIENIYHNQGCGDFLARASRMAGSQVQVSTAASRPTSAILADDGRAWCPC